MIDVCRKKEGGIPSCNLDWSLQKVETVEYKHSLLLKPLAVLTGTKNDISSAPPKNWKHLIQPQIQNVDVIDVCRRRRLWNTNILLCNYLHLEPLAVVLLQFLLYLQLVYRALHLWSRSKEYFWNIIPRSKFLHLVMWETIWAARKVLAPLFQIKINLNIDTNQLMRFWAGWPASEMLAISKNTNTNV